VTIRELIYMVVARLVNPRQRALKAMPSGSVCAEIGVWKGSFSERILAITKPETLHLIDPWEFCADYPDLMFGGISAKSQEDMDEIYSDTCRRLQDRVNVKIHRGTSEQILTEFPDSFFDWVYIDGNHHYEFVAQDLELSYQKVKSGGFIAGEDYGWGKHIGRPVFRAVHDFLKNHSDVTLRTIFSQYILQKR